MGYSQIAKQPHLAGLWLSQVFSSIGDQIYSIAIVWISIQTGGASAGFVTGAGSLAGVLFGLIGGVYADRWNKRTTMVVVDILRAITVLALGVIGSFMPLNLWILGIASVIVAGLGSLFDPALAASLPELTQGNEKSLQAMNALMQVNHRLARTIGPLIAGWLVAVTALHHFFSVDALTFLVSALVVFLIRGNYKWRTAQTTEKGLRGVWTDLKRGAQIVYTQEQILWSFGLYVGANIAWAAGFMVGLPLWAKSLPHADVSTYGTIVAAYGIGSVSSNVIMGTVNSRKRMLFISVSQIIFAIGFAIISVSPNMLWACFGALLAATGGPVGDVMLMIMLQTDVPRKDLGKVFSLRQCVMYLGSCVGLMMAAFIYENSSPQTGIALTAVAFLLLGIVGLLKFGAKESVYRPFVEEEFVANETANETANEEDVEPSLRK